MLDTLAKLSALRIDEDRADALIADIDEMLAFANKLQQLDTGGVSETAQLLPLENVLRADEAKPSFARDEVLKNAPERKGDGFGVPPVIAQGG